MNHTTQEGPNIFTVKEAASYLRLSEMTILRLANAGTIPGARVGRQWRFPKDAILNLIRQPAEMPAPQGIDANAS